MSKLLKSRLPLINNGASVDGTTFNRTVRLLELSLDAFDPDSTPQFTREKRDTLKFNTGDLIWNTTINTLQVFDGATGLVYLRIYLTQLILLKHKVRLVLFR